MLVQRGGEHYGMETVGGQDDIVEGTILRVRVLRGSATRDRYSC